MIPILYINLDRSLNRDKVMREALSELNVNYSRISGIDLDKIGKNALKDGEYDGMKYLIKQNIIFKPRSKEIAIILSHLKVIKEIIDKEYEMAVVMEDDLSFRYVDDWNEQVSDIVKNAPKDWKILKLHTSTPSEIEKNIEWIKKKIYYVPVNSKSIQSAGCYIINRQGAENLIKKYCVDNIYTFPAKKEYVVAECVLFSEPGTYLYTIPLICAQENNLTCVGNYNILDISSNKVIHKYWESIGKGQKIDMTVKRDYHIEEKRERFKIRTIRGMVNNNNTVNNNNQVNHAL